MVVIDGLFGLVWVGSRQLRVWLGYGGLGWSMDMLVVLLDIVVVRAVGCIGRYIGRAMPRMWGHRYDGTTHVSSCLYMPVLKVVDRDHNAAKDDRQGV
ncbi:hypothetical protein BT67DRAFT_445117 [Trichocladium antarcticum]|uniref:Uncharacterized protein n=1 Tax=Trichocladium antarcticum TaxID=1450529 RepID=A0AAN6UE26_9PEZI|nr:hypothetical protein BT67DRAFT_445117 [Trichocladium antarcticum]